MAPVLGDTRCPSWPLLRRWSRKTIGTTSQGRLAKHWLDARACAWGGPVSYTHLRAHETSAHR
eukprot:14832425-Alexandrium_andersonii.AAC.1